MRWLLLPLVLASCAQRPRAPASPASLPRAGAEYVVRIADPSSKRVEVRARFQSPSARDLRLRIDRRYAFLEVERNFVEELRATADGHALAVEPEGADAWVVSGSRGKEVEAEWTIELRHREEIARRETDKPDQYEHPYLASDHAFLVGSAVFLLPEGLDGPFRVRFDLPEGWPVDAPWAGSPESGFLAPDAESLRQNYVFIGRGRRMGIEVEGLLVDLVLAPGTSAPATELEGRIERIARAEIALLGAPRSPRYLVVVPQEGRLWGAGGSAKRDSLVLAFGWGASLPTIEHLIAHELAHTLAPSRSGFDDDARFAMEGFADYLGALARWRADLLSERRFLEEAARQAERWIAAVDRSGLSLAEAAKRFFTDRDAYEMTYAGGFVLGFVLDHRLEGGLPALYRLLDEEGKAPDARAIRRALARLGGGELAAAFDRVVSVPSGEGILRELAPRFAARVEREVDRRIGVQFRRGTEPVVAWVVERSPADRAGVRSGDRIVSFDGEPIEEVRDFFRARRRSSGDGFSMKVRREDQEIECAAVYGSRVRVSLSRGRAGT